jgi:hypothetical protein
MLEASALRFPGCFMADLGHDKRILKRREKVVDSLRESVKIKLCL